MSQGPIVPGNRVYPGTSQHWTYGQFIDSRSFWKAAVLITAVALGAVLVLNIVIRFLP